MSVKLNTLPSPPSWRSSHPSFGFLLLGTIAFTGWMARHGTPTDGARPGAHVKD